jgi:glycerol-3-phosphate dehydrogenase
VREVDVFVIGGGINGCGVARDLTGRGYTVALAEMADLAQGTSSGSTKLIHGGLRYLEHYEFRLVRESLIERERLWAMAPHIIWPLRFVLPHHGGLRPAWMLRLGLFLYDHLGGRKRLPAARTLDLRNDPAGTPLKPAFVKGFEYSDCWVDDARLVVLNARDAADRGADIRTRTEVISARPGADGRWTIETENLAGGARERLSAGVLINAAGPWVDRVLAGVLGRNAVHNVRLVQGSHIVVRKLFDHDRCYIFQNADGRIVFAIPYEGDYTLIGTTDRDYEGDPASIEISEEEKRYLVEAASEYFARPVTTDDIAWTYSAVRPLYDDGASSAQEATRDYVLTSEQVEGAGLINVFGGKITTYRRLAEEVADRVDDLSGRRTSAWTAGATLPGGDMGVDGVERLIAELSAAHPFLTRAAAARLVHTYGTGSRTILGQAKTADDLGEDFGAGLTEAELRYLVEKEWARSAEDVLYRRTKLALHLDEDGRERLARWFAANVA